MPGTKKAPKPRVKRKKQIAPEQPTTPDGRGEGDSSGSLTATFARLFSHGSAGSGEEAAGGGRSVASLLASAPSLRSAAAEPGGEVRGDAGSALAVRFTRLFKPGAPGSGGLPTPKGPESAPRKRKLAEAEGVGAQAELQEEEKPKKKKNKRWLNDDEEKEREARTLFVGNVPVLWDEKRLRNFIRKAVGDKYTGPLKPIWFRDVPVEDKFLGRKRKVGAVRGFYRRDADAKNAYVLLESEAAVGVVLKIVHNMEADTDHPLRADGVGPYSRFHNFDRKRSIFVGNLPPSTTEAELRSALSPAGLVDAVRLVRDSRTKVCKGVAFVRFRERSSLKAALELEYASVQGRTLRIMRVEAERGPRDLDSMYPAQRRIELKKRRRTQKLISKW